MTTTNGVYSSLEATMNGASSSSSASAAKDIEDRFLKLLVAQMKNQDPLNPLENAEVTSQMAQLSTVTGINQLNTSLDGLMADIQSSQALQAADMIGHGVFTPGKSLTLKSAGKDADGNDKGSLAVFGVQLPSAADSVKVSIVDSTGTVVHSIDMGKQEKGMLPLTWDGKISDDKTLENGEYTFKVEATLAGENVNVETLSFGLVESVSLGASGVQLNVQDIGAISYSDVREIL